MISINRLAVNLRIQILSLSYPAFTKWLLQSMGAECWWGLNALTNLKNYLLIPMPHKKNLIHILALNHIIFLQ